MKTLLCVWYRIEMKIKHVYIDESGNAKNTKSCVICFVIFDDLTALDKLSVEIEAFKLKRFGNLHTELHFNKESFSTKRLFFELLSRYSFAIRYYQTIISDKNLNYEECILKSIKENIQIFNNSQIYIDGNKSQNPQMIRKIKSFLKENRLKIHSVRLLDSRKHLIIQVADMCAGCIRRALDRGTAQDLKLFNLIKNHINT